MKRMAMTLCGLLLAFSLSGCAGGTQHEPPATSSAVPAESSETTSKSYAESSEPVPVNSVETKESLPQGSSESGEEKEVFAESGIDTSSLDALVSQQAQLPSLQSQISSEEETVMKMNVQIGDSAFTATLEENAAATSFVELMKTAPVVIQMSDYSGFEKVGSLGTSLPASDSQTRTQSGDIVLYNGNQIVIFYGSNSWSYTRLGKIDDLSGWEDALGNGDVTVTFSVG